jgi:ligand-binding sensor domain-containing protein/serine phosphatase RsbU (regulator of sigma subunit)
MGHHGVYRILLVLIFLAAFVAKSQEAKDIRFRTLSIEHGLSQSSVNALLEDKQGTIWIGTQDGLNRYNGIGFNVFNFNQNDTTTISSGHIRSLLECKDGLIWVGTEGAGLNSYNKLTGKFTRYYYDKSNESSLSNNHVRCLLESISGAIIVGTTGGGVCSFDKNTGKFTRFTGRLKSGMDVTRLRVESLFEDEKGVIWVGTNKNGLITFNPRTSELKEVFHATDLQNARITAITRHDDSRIWIATYGDGLVLLDRRNNNIVRHFSKSSKQNNIPSDFIVSVLQDDEQRLWMGTYGSGLIIYNPIKNTFKHLQHQKDLSFSLSNNDVWSLCKTKEGVMFVGTDGGGISLYNKTSQKFRLYRNTTQSSALSNNMVRCIFEDSKGLWWIGTYGGGLSSYDPFTEKYTSFKSDPKEPYSISTDRVVSILETPDGLLWFGTDGGGLNKYDRKTGRFYAYKHISGDTASLSNDVIWCMSVEKDKGLWLGTRGGGLNFFDFKTETFQVLRNNPIDNTTIGSDFIRCIVQENNNYLWVGTEGGGFCQLDKNTLKVKNYKNGIKNNNTLNNNTVRCLHIEYPNKIWIGTDGGGLNLLNTDTEEFTHYTEKDGLPNNVIYGILSDGDGDLWMSTNKGICRFKKDGQQIFIKNYDISDGLQSNEFNTGAYFKNAKGELFFGGINGFNKFLPEDIKENTFVPTVILTDFKVFEKQYPLDTLIEFKRELILHYTENFFSFGFASLSFSMPEKNRYAYKMEGFDKDWVEVQNRNYASYTNLDPGTYVFRVKASNNDGYWNNNGVAVRVIILPPFYKTTWFYSLCLFVVLLSIFLYIKVRERKLRREKAVLEKTVRQRTSEILEKNIALNKQQQEITDSINYAKRIQQAILPLKDEVQACFAEAFIYYLPKDIVSGDFYWYKRIDANNVLLAMGDCTGHGVPGALMSMIGLDKLNEITIEEQSPGKIIAQLNNEIKRSLRQASFDVLEDNFSTNDGMDIALCKINIKTLEVEYAGANRPLWIFRKNTDGFLFEEIPPTKESVGGFTDEDTHFETSKLHLNKGDSIYLFSDGYSDQFGGTGTKRGKKFMTKNLKLLIQSIQPQAMDAQLTELDNAFNAWKGDFEQVDDICIIGVRV